MPREGLFIASPTSDTLHRGKLYPAQPAAVSFSPLASAMQVFVREGSGQSSDTAAPSHHQEARKCDSFVGPTVPRASCGQVHISCPASRVNTCPELCGQATGFVLSQEVCLQGEAAAGSSLWVPTAAFIISFLLLLVGFVVVVLVLFCLFFFLQRTD